MSVAASGTQATTLATEHSLYAATASGVYTLSVDASALLTGETLTLKIKKKVLTAGTIRLAYSARFKHALDAPIIESPPIACPFGATFTLQQDGGTARSFDWSVQTL